jgi:hypothetical protein
MLALFIVLGVILVTGLIAVPVIEEADAKCEVVKKNGDLCKPRRTNREWVRKHMKNQELMLTALFIILGAVLVTGLVAVPIIEEAEAKRQPGETNNKGWLWICETEDGKEKCGWISKDKISCEKQREL